jgi:hypothetical protein
VRQLWWAAGVTGAMLGVALAGGGVMWWSLRPVPMVEAPNATAHAALVTPVPHVAITLFDPSFDDDVLVAVRWEIPGVSAPVEHARLVVEAALERATSAEVALIPAGVMLKTIFLTDQGEAVLNLTGLPPTGWGAGFTTERLAVHSLISAITANVPSTTAVRLLLNGQPLETAGGHLDLRGPLTADREALRALPLPNHGFPIAIP